MEDLRRTFLRKQLTAKKIFKKVDYFHKELYHNHFSGLLTRGFLMFSGGTEVEYWLKMGELTSGDANVQPLFITLKHDEIQKMGFS